MGVSGYGVWCGGDHYGVGCVGSQCVVRCRWDWGDISVGVGTRLIEYV